MNGRLFLRRTCAGWSAGTLVVRRGPQRDDGIATVSPWTAKDIVFDVPVDDLVERRPRGGAARPKPRLQTPQRLPLVQATKRAREAAEEHGVRRPLENIVLDALLDGAASHDPEEGGAAIVGLDRGRLIAIVTRTRSRSSGRKAWLVVAVRKAAA